MSAATTQDARTLPVWRTIKLGLQPTLSEYRDSIHHAGVHINGNVDDMLQKMLISPSIVEVDLVKLTLMSLELIEEPIRYGQVCRRGIEMGFDLCPAEVGPALILQCREQSAREYLVIVMNYLLDRYNQMNAFTVISDGKGESGLFFVGAEPLRPQQSWSDFVFVRPRSMS